MMKNRPQTNRFRRLLSGAALSFVLLGSVPEASAQVPTLFNYQGRIQVGGTDFDGNGEFRFALTENVARTATAVVDRTGTVITGITIVNGGNGYSNPTVTISGGGGSGASAVATVVGGKITGFTNIVGGGSYTSDPTVTISAPDPSLNIIWSNDGTIGVPSNRVNINVTEGLYSVLLGDTSKENMVAIPQSVLARPDVRLRVWFGDRLLSPDQRLSTGTVPVPLQLTGSIGSTRGQLNLKNTGSAPETYILSGTVGAVFGVANSRNAAAPGFGGIAFQASPDSTQRTRMQIAENGNVGIGTTSPTSKLHVVGDIATTVPSGSIRTYQNSFNHPTLGIANGSGSSRLWELFVEPSGRCLYKFRGAAGGGVSIFPGQSAWSAESDRNSKKNFTPVDVEEIADKLAKIELQRWHYKWDADDTVPHIGPMAQDFKPAFFPGRAVTSISTLEFDGVALAAIQGVYRKLEREQVKNADLEKRLAAMEAREKKLNTTVALLNTRDQERDAKLITLQRMVESLGATPAATTPVSLTTANR